MGSFPKYRDRDGITTVGAILAGLLITIALAGSAFAYYYLFLKKAVPSASVALEAPPKIYVGQPFDVTMTATNNAEGPLTKAAVSITLPEGISLVGGSERFKEEDLGDLESGAMATRTVRLVAKSGAGNIKRLDAKFRYAPVSQPDQEFASKASADLIVQGSAELNLEAPHEVLSGQKFDVTFKYRNVSEKPILNARFQLSAPSFFRITNSSSSPEAGREGTIWNFGDLQPNATGTIILEGLVSSAQTKSFFEIGGKITSDAEGQTFDIISKSVNIGIAEAPLSLSATINGEADHIAKLDEYLTYKLHYKNNADVAFRNVVITANISGRVLDYTSIQTDAVLNSLTNTLTWDSTNTPELITVAPGSEGDVDFRVHLKNTFNMKSVSDKNYTLKLQMTISSPTVPPGVNAQNTISASGLETKVAGGVDLQSFALYSDAASGVINKGPYPPKASKTTQFTIHWRMKNSATDVSQVHLEATLLSGAKFLKVVKSSTESKPVVSQSGVVTWDIPKIAATQGYVGLPVEAVFQIEITPGVNRAGDDLKLLSKTILTAHDDFTGQEIKAEANEVTAGAQVLP